MNWIVLGVIIVLTIVIATIEYRRSGSKGAVAILVIGVIISVLAGALFQSSSANSDRTGVDTSGGTVHDSLPSPTEVSSKEDEVAKFIKDYRIGHDNGYGNLEYFNRGGLVCKQDEMYYISANSALYKTRDFSSFEYITEGEIIANICVLGDWIYYTSGNTIYKIRTDGAQKEAICETQRGIIRMNAKGDWLYFVSNEDGLLYKVIKNGEALTRLTDIPVSSFIVVGEHIYFTSGVFEKIYDTGHSMSLEGFYKLSLYTNEISRIALPMSMGHEAIPGDMNYYNGVFYIFANGLQRFDFESEAFALIDERHMAYTSTIDNRMYYINRLQGEYDSFCYYDVSSNAHVKISTPYENDNYISWFYPTTHGIIYAHNFADWSIMSLDGTGNRFLEVS